MSKIKIAKLNGVEGRKSEFEPIDELVKHSRGEETNVSFSSAIPGIVMRIAANEACKVLLQTANYFTVHFAPTAEPLVRQSHLLLLEFSFKLLVPLSLEEQDAIKTFLLNFASSGPRF